MALSVLLRILSFFRRTEPNLEEFIYRQDIIYVGGGNTATLRTS
ncbi:Type 1 glutamine amidotransferase-like domain-containing protein [Rothia dentocariosa]|nr:Type 1 glutamine amidotransferase-like domain-containing protein [Rothia dentocariosa]